MCMWRVFALICLVSGASAVSLVPRPEDRTKLLSSSYRSFSGPPSSPSLFCTGMLGGGGNRTTLVSRGYLTAAAQAARLAFSYVLGLLSLCCICSAVSTACRERCHVRFYVSL